AIGGSYLLLITGAIFEGLARAFYSGNNDALLYDTLAEMDQRESFQEYLGKTSSMYQFALAISAVIGGLIASVSFHLVMWVSVIPPILALLLSLRLVEPKAYLKQPAHPFAHLSQALRNFCQNPRLRTLSSANILSYAI